MYCISSGFGGEKDFDLVPAADIASGENRYELQFVELQGIGSWLCGCVAEWGGPGEVPWKDLGDSMVVQIEVVNCGQNGC